MAPRTSIRSSVVGLLAIGFTANAKPVAQIEERAAACNADNLLRRFRDDRYASAAVTFCQTYINAVAYETVTVTTDATA